MLHKRNDLEIVELLRKHSRHIRQIAKDLDLIPSTVMRTMKRLEKENIVDFKREGKNKVYSLKNNPETDSYLFMVEKYKLLKLMQDAGLRRIAKLLQEKTDGELIVLFGSHAKRTADKNSDVDIFIETDNRDIRKELTDISEKLSIKIGKLDKDNLLSKEIINNHIIIQNVDRFYQATGKIS